ncbi:MAG: Na/Pi cotransporter family protein [Oscillospiraceae bacterium]|nr:Na/Pi cotransporter family protein [Oscillospiraceae bacterium]
MNISNILNLLGGIALFLFGMTLMGDGLKKVAGNKLELVLYQLSGTPLRGVLLGAGVTAVIQSSSATSVMAVGFVNSGVMKLRQAISVIQGALIGTSITGWIIALSSLEGAGWTALLSTSNLSALVAVVGILLHMFSKKQLHRHVGDILMGFAVLMFGMHSMSSAVEPLRDNAYFLHLMSGVSHPLLGILVGAVFTAILQSASAAVGILQALSMTGAITFSQAYPLILGIAIGSSLPVLMAAIGAKVDGRRAAWSYLIIEVLGVLIFGVLYYVLDAFFHFGLDNLVVGTFSVALINTVFRAATSFALLPFDRQIEKLTVALIKESEDEKSLAGELDRLDERFLEHPVLAVEQSRMTVNAMARTARENVLRSMGLIGNYSESQAQKVEMTEDLVDLYEDKLGTYLVRLNAHELNKEQNESVSKYLHTLSDFERISDHAMNIMEVAREIHEKKIAFSDDAGHELKVLTAALSEILKLSVDSFINEDLDMAYRVEPLEERIDILCDEMKLNHVERLQEGRCSLNVGFVFNDLITNFERVADHCSNIAIAMIELQSDEYDTHGYVINLKELHSHDFDRLYDEYTQKYAI